MYDYMQALQDRFFQEPRDTELQQRIKAIHHHLCSELDKQNRRKLLELIDLQGKLCEDTSLSSFIAGFRLASGIAREMGMEAPYSFAKEEEQRMIEALAQGGMNHGEA